MDKDKFEMLKLVSDLAEHETDRTWGRTMAIMTANAGLFVLVSVAIQKDLQPLVVAVAAVGVLLAILWYCIATISKHYEERWHKDMEAIILEDDDLTKFVRGRNKPRTARPRTWSATTCLKIIIVLMGLVWLLILVLSLSGRLQVLQQERQADSVKAALARPSRRV